MDHRAIRRLKPVLKWLLRVLPFLHRWYEKGYFSTSTRRQRFVNWFFKRVFRVNADCKWSVHFTSRVVCPEDLDIGCDVERSLMFSAGCYIQAGNGIRIGDRTIFGPGVKMISANHDMESETPNRWLPDPPICIGNSCWLGANSIILPGVELGDNVIVGAGSVVTRSFADSVTIAGNPAKIVESGPKPSIHSTDGRGNEAQAT